MTTRTDSDSPGLGALLADTLECDLPEVELLVRYADDPESLAPEERSRVEWELDRSPIFAAQLRLLRRTDFDALRQTSDFPQTQARAPSHWRFASARWLSLAAAAALILWITQASERRSDAVSPTASVATQADARSTKLARVEPRAQEDAAPATILADGATSDSGAHDRVASPAEGDISSAAAVATAAVDPAVPRVVARSSEEHVASQADRVRRAPEPRAVGEPEAVSAQRAKARSASSTNDRSDLANVVVGSSPATEPPSEAQLMALQLPRYRAPAGSDPRPHRSSRLRGSAEGFGVRALVPPHVARTGRASPTLFWTLDALPPMGAQVEFSITTSTLIEPLVRRSLPTPLETGVQRIELDPSTEVLPEGTELRWSLAVRTGIDAEMDEELVSGWIVRVPRSDALQSDLADAPPADIPAILADAGFWYDALEATVELVERYPDHPRLAEALSELLEQSGH